jgi:hypothetical protein
MAIIRVPDGAACDGALYLQDEHGSLLGPGNIAPGECVRGPLPTLSRSRLCCDELCSELAITGPEAECARRFDVTGREL